MPGKSPRKPDTARTGKPTRMPSASPFVGRPIHVAFGPDDDPSSLLECLAHEGNFLLVRGEAGELWINLDHVAKVVVEGGGRERGDGGSPGVDDKQVADAIAAFKANPGPLKDTGA